MRDQARNWGPVAATGAVILTVPIWLTAPYHLHLVITIAMLSIAALGARLLLLLGLWSFGQGVFLTIGAYTSAILVVDLGLSFWAALPIAAVGGALAAAAVGFPALRLQGVYFAIFTMVLVFAVRQGIILSPEVTRGASGFVGVPRPDSFSIGGVEFSFGSRERLYMIVAVLLLLTMVVMHRIDRSRLAKVLSAIRQGEVLAESVGINLARYRMGAFVIAAFFTTATGAFSAHYYSAAHPEIWSLWPSIFIITYAIIGGVGSVFGPVIGATVGVLVVEVLRATQGLQGILFGVALIVVMFVMPGGLTSVFSQVTLSRLRRWKADMRTARDGSERLRRLVAGSRKNTSSAPPRRESDQLDQETEKDHENDPQRGRR